MLSMPSSDKAALCMASVVKRVFFLHVLFTNILSPRAQWAFGGISGCGLMTLGNGLAFKVFNCIIRIWGLAPWVDIRNNRSTVKFVLLL